MTEPRALDEAISRALADETDSLSGTFETVCESAWVDWSRGRRDVTLDGDFTAAELRRLAELITRDADDARGAWYAHETSCPRCFAGDVDGCDEGRRLRIAARSPE